MIEKIIDKAVEFIFSKNISKYLIPIFILGFTLRVLIAFHGGSAADEMVYGPHAIGFIDSGKLGNMDGCAVWFFLTDLSAKIFGANYFGLRFPSILFGSLTIILTYLIGKELFDEKKGLLAAFIISISAMQLKITIAEMDIPMTFFFLLSLYFFILYFKTEQKKYFIFTWASLGISIMIKQIALLFIPAFVLFHIYYNKKNKKPFPAKKIIFAGLIILLTLIPTFTFNYLLYKDKGIVDIQTARYTKISLKTYESLAPTMNTFKPYELLFADPPGIIAGLSQFYMETFIVLILSIIGLFFFFKSKNQFTLLLILSFLFPFTFLSSGGLLPNHFVFGTFFFAILAALPIAYISDKLKTKNLKKWFIYAIVIILIISMLINIYAFSYTLGFFGKNELQKMIEYKDRNIEKNALVIADARIYRGRIVFMFWDRHYLESSLFPQLMQESEKINEQAIPVPTYFIEAVTDDSGWGTIKDQPDFNKSTEDLVSFFKNNSRLVETIYDISGNKHFNVYRNDFSLKPSVLPMADSTHQWFFYPVAYKPASQVFDNYETHNIFDALLDKIAHLILYLEVALAILSSFLIFYYLYKSLFS